jgi:hypothetical protein
LHVREYFSGVEVTSDLPVKFLQRREREVNW